MTSNPPDGPPGYGNPPKANQFKHGQSGNPRGRPKENKSQTFHDTIRKRLQERPVLASPIRIFCVERLLRGCKTLNQRQCSVLTGTHKCAEIAIKLFIISAPVALATVG